ncbi:MAG: diguanylate cyclase [Chloroflexi bacterium]|nr:diguanylate cyclase [Chloroflexota bacterium]
MKILIVDDEPWLRWILRTQLARLNHEVIEAEDGQAAWEMWQREAFPMVITDWMMPNMDGVGLIRRIRAASTPSYTYIVMLTVRTDKSDVVTGLEDGADDYLTKPFDAGELQARVAVGERILGVETRLRESLAEQSELAARDGLTSIYNRRAFDYRLADEIRRARRYNRPLALIMVDIDHFKNYNDRHGHVQGDRVLQELAKVLVNSVRATDFVARYGGEEFAIILPETNKTSSMAAAEKIRTAVAAHPFPLGSSQPNGALTLSLGIANYPEDMPDGDVLVERADQALYRAKQTGRNRAVLAG